MHERTRHCSGFQVSVTTIASKGVSAPGWDPGWYHGNAKHRVLKEDRERRTALQRKNEMLRMKMERKKAYDKWVKRVAPPQLDSNKVGEMKERVQRLRDPAPRKTQRDRARARRPRRKKDREGFDAGESPAPEPYIRQPEPGTSVSDRGGYMPRFGGKSSSRCLKHRWQQKWGS